MMRYAILLLAGALLSTPAAAGNAAPERWLLVDTINLRLLVVEGTTVVHTYEGISIGRDGATNRRRRGDQRTPLGRFQVAWIHEDSPFHRFLGLDYPDLELAGRALSEGRISDAEWEAIRRAHRNGAIPPQDTALGGQIGLHGIGAGAPEVHHLYNWTNGCVALTNEQIDELLHWVGIGTRVDIR